jgi:dihydroneopterin aldolase/2-amino-4-hydroxy-6-hydroxymethyldihydropteridine diphosphokinase
MRLAVPHAGRGALDSTRDEAPFSQQRNDAAPDTPRRGRARVAVGLGSNLGNRTGYLQEAIDHLAAVTTLVATSSIYETAPVGGPDQGAYLNAVAVVETDLAARRLLEVMLDVERRMGRVRRERWGPRTIDLDLLLHGDSAVDEPGLTVPHPRLTERRFALEPLLEAWPEATLPDGRPLADFLEAVADQDVVRVASSE